MDPTSATRAELDIYNGAFAGGAAWASRRIATALRQAGDETGARIAETTVNGDPVYDWTLPNLDKEDA
jgi:hypothetical protein